MEKMAGNEPRAQHIKIAVIQFNPIVGAIARNRKQLVAAYAKAAEDGADIVISPEMSLTGYPLEDLVLSESFLDSVQINECQKLFQDIVLLGYKAAFIFGSPSKSGEIIYNTACFINPEKKIWQVSQVNKQELPNYGVFDEKRTFSSDRTKRNTILWRDLKIGLMICEDGWFPKVSGELAADGADLLISINGSPFETGKVQRRHEIVRSRVAETGLPFVYANMVGGQDELVFDGGSFCYTEDGEALTAPQFEEGTYIFDIKLSKKSVDLSKTPMPITFLPNPMNETYRAVVLGTRDYLRKQNFTSVVLGYSGGVDSGLVAAIACDAIGPDNVHLVRLPSKFSSESSLVDAEEGAKRLGANMRTIDIEPVVNALREAYRLVNGNELTGIADENIQARARGTILMAISNQEKHIVLTTGNKSECSIGYSTLYGDMNGGFNPIKDCYKTLVWELCRWRNGVEHPGGLFGFHGRAGIVVPEDIITKPPSAELREGQTDQDTLPPYKVLDFILHGLIERENGLDKIADDLSESIELRDALNDDLSERFRRAVAHKMVSRICKLVANAEYKRRQAAPGVKVSGKIHGRDRRYPIVNHWMIS